MTAQDETLHPDVAEAIAGELRLLEPAVRDSRELALPLFDPEFEEVGASGRHWTYEEMLDALPAIAGNVAEGTQYEPGPVTGVLLAPGLVHVRFETVKDGRLVRRSSIWRRDPAGPADGPLRMYYHQGTPVPDEFR
ncbi:DUF4440 domain-containing protein [Streptomyces sp. NPDC056144]|uniref:nuclear transport factor 2 family protein n=1 Tax=unclassified Streptomyces TaxID=2593676 RepID=UPI0035E392BA